MTAPDSAPLATFEPASLFRRSAAFVYDSLLLTGLLFVFTLLVLMLRGGRSIPPSSAWFELCLTAVALAFYSGFWMHGGQTLGMRAWRIRVVRIDGGALEWWRAGARFGAGIVALLPAGLGLWWGFFDRQRRGWHDLVTGTRVIRVPT